MTIQLPCISGHGLRAVVTLSLILTTVAEARSERQQTGEDADGFVSIFDGATLTGWRAVPEESASDWSMRDGVIVGTGSADRLSYLVWQDEQLENFELKLEYRFQTEGNSGVEIRSRVDVTGKRPFEGYHADIGHVGIGPHILGAWDFHFATRREYPCERGTRLRIDTDGEPHYSTINDPVTLDDIHQGDWNVLYVIARDNKCQMYLNGKAASKFTDETAERLRRGAIGLQIHDKGMQVEFRNILVRRLP